MYRLMLCLAFLLAAGCRGEPPYTDHSKDPEAYAVKVKQMISAHVAEARKSKTPGDQMLVIVNELKNYQRRPTGSYESTYAELFSASSEILEACKQANGRPKDLDARLTKLAAIAETLPGNGGVGSSP